MDADVLAELVTIQKLVAEANIADVPRLTVLRLLKRLPRLYEELCSTYQSRYADEIHRLVRNVFETLPDNAAFAPDASRVTEAISTRLRDVHRRLGIPGLGVPGKQLAPPAAAPGRPLRKAG